MSRGGGNATSKRQFRRGLSLFFERAGLKGRMPRFVCCGGRSSAYEDFCTAIARAREDEFIVLLVDSEQPVNTGVGSWSHLKSRDDWDQPTGATDEHAHLMVQCMEAWFLADRGTLGTYFGAEFNTGPRRYRKHSKGRCLQCSEERNTTLKQGQVQQRESLLRYPRADRLDLSRYRSSPSGTP